MSSSQGTKVTKDPSALNDPKNENPGVVTSDSLAGESIQSGGSFAANSDARGPMGQSSAGTNTNNTDTSGARTLNAAPDAEARQAQEGWSETAAVKAGDKLGGKDAGIGPTYNEAAGGSSGSGGGGNYSSGSGQGAKAPGYYDNPAPSMGDSFKPKGANLKEGGFSSDDPNASFDTDIGGKNDPGRAALGAMEARDAAPSGGAGARDQKVTGDGQFSNLDETSA
ncbi:hypothetical protein BAUCODRAFT_146165 [Baudoinia panamericana UAMH 10762]|uniref:Uncharacterized protein n=1 Tax=Baudoinia panamericana (strain UAMH 10762) TaxID=717646 RepID=M2NIH3_BAUPA|nr:uncharacterized protein BAUCODRAFT_146165 [Baudoinia panamericana UAMH 10762]EMC99189.1 hypothetical protein BAUCODRAFT_146165 [Baudoinia panamericana UAMH 10762]